jgi:hypothetical protein
MFGFRQLFLSVFSPSSFCLLSACHDSCTRMPCHAMPGAPAGKGSQSFFHNQRHAHACHASSCAGSGCWLRLLADDPAAAV